MRELTASELQEIQGDLRDLAESLRNALDASAAGAKPVDLDEPIGRISRMDAIQQQSMARASRQASQLRLKQVQAALRRVSADEYGACQECGEAIGFSRLKVRPEAPFCVACQSRRESRAAS